MPLIAPDHCFDHDHDREYDPDNEPGQKSDLYCLRTGLPTKSFLTAGTRADEALNPTTAALLPVRGEARSAEIHSGAVRSFSGVWQRLM